MPVPEGNVRRRKGVTSYFFERSKAKEITDFLEKTHDATGKPIDMYTCPTTAFMSADRERWSLLFIEPAVVIVGVVRFN